MTFYRFNYCNCVFVCLYFCSVFVRDCKECKLLVACQQFRTRDCKRIHIFLSCKSQPIIEASTEMYFGCYQCYYSELSSELILIMHNLCNFKQYVFIL